MDAYGHIISAFLNGRVSGLAEGSLIPEHLETQISHLFLFPQTVYKICKRDNSFFNQNFRNLSDLSERLYFYKADFAENQYFSPEVYIDLFGIKMTNDQVILTNPDEKGIEDIVMKMKRIDLEYNLSNLLHAKSLAAGDFRRMGYQQTEAVAKFPQQPKTDKNYYLLFQEKLDDLRDWLYSAPNYFSLTETDEFIKVLKDYVDKNKKDFLDFNTNEYVVSLDNHSDNIFYQDNRMFFLDIYPPKEDWMIVTPWINIYRPMTDILILMGEEAARAFLQGYKDYYGFLDERHELLYCIYSAGIQGVSLYNLSDQSQVKKRDALVYKKFIVEGTKKLLTLS